MKLIYYPNELLTRAVRDVDLENPGFDPFELKAQMVELMLMHKGMGLSANQIGLDAKLFVMGTSLLHSSMYINPTVLEYKGIMHNEIEGCLSFPDIYVNIERATEIVVHYYDENLEECTVNIEGEPAVRCFLHELDHLLGITMKDHVSSLKWNMAKNKAKKLRK